MSMNGLLCPELADRGLVERYLGGRLSTEEAENFEQHYLTCQQCQDELRLAVFVRSGLRVIEQGRTEPGASDARRRSLVAWRVGAGLALAAGLAILLVARASRAGPLAALGAVSEVPIYLGVPVRAADDSGSAWFERGVRAYAEGRYEDAAADLRAATAQDPSLVPARFFLAASLLLDGRAGDAAKEFGRSSSSVTRLTERRRTSTEPKPSCSSGTAGLRSRN